MNPLEDAWSALKAAGRHSPVGGSKTAPTYSGGPGSWSFPAHKDPTERITGKRKDTGGGGRGPSIVPAVGGPPEGITQAIHGMGEPEPEPPAAPGLTENEWLKWMPQREQERPQIDEYGRRAPTADEQMWTRLLSQAGHHGY